MAAAQTATASRFAQFSHVCIGSGVGYTELQHTLTVHHIGGEPTTDEIVACLTRLQSGNSGFFGTLGAVTVVRGSTKRIKHQPPECPSAQYQSELSLFRRSDGSQAAVATSQAPSAPTATPRLLMGINQHGEGTCPSPRCDERLYGMRQGEGTCYHCGAGLKIYLR